MSSRNKISLQELDDFVDDDNNEEYNENYQQDADFLILELVMTVLVKTHLF